MVETHQYTSHNIIEKNTFRDFSFMGSSRGAIQIGNNSPSNLVVGNYIRDITDPSYTDNAFVNVQGGSPSTQVFNNVLLMSTAIDDDVFAFHLDASGHTGTGVNYNTVYNLDKGVYFQDNASPPDFQFKNNILYQINDVYFAHSGTGGRFTVDHNSYGIVPTQTGGTYYWPDATSVTGDPQFLDPTFFGSPYGFTLKAGSNCLSAGTSVTDISVDLQLDIRDGSTPTIGAFENILTETYWTGAISNDWHDHRNWGPPIIPGTFLDVIIPLRKNDPLIFNNDASCKSIEIQPGAKVDVNSPHSLTIIN
jgi:hypothetical protein